MFSEELKKSTLHVHQGVEEQLVSRIRKINSVSGYVELLKVMYGFYTPVQRGLDGFVRNGGVSELTGRDPEWLLNDIRFFSPVNEEDIRLCEDIPPIISLPAALGVMYVTEGSALGGQIITKMIIRNSGISPNGAFSFLNAYGDRTGAVWNQFKTILNRPRPRNEQEQISEAAMSTFLSFNQWISEYE